VVVVIVAALAGTGIWVSQNNSGDNAPGTATSTNSTAVPTVTDTGPPGTTSVAPTVAPAQLSSILLSLAQINGILGTSGIVVTRDASDMKDPGPEDTVSEETCRGALIGFQTRTYKSSGYTAMKAQLMDKPGSNLATPWSKALHYFSPLSRPSGLWRRKRPRGETAPARP
jgi:hypothetical protein